MWGRLSQELSYFVNVANVASATLHFFVVFGSWTVTYSKNILRPVVFGWKGINIVLCGQGNSLVWFGDQTTIINSSFL